MFTHAFAHLAARDDDAAPANHLMVNLVVVLLVLLIVALLLVGGLLFLRARRRARRAAELPIYEEKRPSTSTSSSGSTHRRVMVRPEPVYVYQEKQNLIENSSSPPQSPKLPEIHITFPEEYDAAGKRQSGRVVVVRVGDAGLGLEPAEDLPAYEREAGGRFHSVDLERVGGLIEKARNAPSKEFQ